MIAIVDYGVGNLFSLKSSLAAIGAEAVVTGDADMLRRADKILLPGMNRLSGFFSIGSSASEVTLP